jgi:hypothetical protein
MDRLPPPDASPEGADRIASPTRPPPRRRALGVAGALAAAYVAFAVGTPWLLREAPPDSYVLAEQAMCAVANDARCADAPRIVPRQRQAP